MARVRAYKRRRSSSARRSAARKAYATSIRHHNRCRARRSSSRGPKGRFVKCRKGMRRSK